MNIRNFGTVCAAALLIAPRAWAADIAGSVKVSRGLVLIERAQQQLPASVGTPIYSNDRVMTGASGSVGITLRDNTLLSAGPNSTLELDKFSFDSTTHAGTIDAKLRRGTLAVISGSIPNRTATVAPTGPAACASPPPSAATSA